MSTASRTKYGGSSVAVDLAVSIVADTLLHVATRRGEPPQLVPATVEKDPGALTRLLDGWEHHEPEDGGLDWLQARCAATNAPVRLHFYEPDPQRLGSREVSFGAAWSDGQRHPWRVFWLVLTGELLALFNGPATEPDTTLPAVIARHQAADVEILTIEEDRHTVERIVHGYQAHEHRPTGLDWLRTHARDRVLPR